MCLPVEGQSRSDVSPPAASASPARSSQVEYDYSALSHDSSPPCSGALRRSQKANVTFSIELPPHETPGVAKPDRHYRRPRSGIQEKYLIAAVRARGLAPSVLTAREFLLDLSARTAPSAAPDERDAVVDKLHLVVVEAVGY